MKLCYGRMKLCLQQSQQSIRLYAPEKNVVTQPNCNSDEEADDERDGLNNIDSDSPDEIHDPPLLDKSDANPGHIEISPPNPDSIV